VGLTDEQRSATILSLFVRARIRKLLRDELKVRNVGFIIAVRYIYADNTLSGNY